MLTAGTGSGAGNNCKAASAAVSGGDPEAAKRAGVAGFKGKPFDK
jgi:hypothetical protein